MEWFYPTSHTGHGQQPPFPLDQLLSSLVHKAKSCVSSWGSRLGAPNPAVSPCPAPPPCFPKKLIQPRGIFLLDYLLPAGWRQSGWGAGASPSSCCPQALLCSRAGMSAPTPVWGSKGSSSCQGVCSKSSYWELDFRCHTLAHQQFQLRLILSLV